MAMATKTMSMRRRQQKNEHEKQSADFWYSVNTRIHRCSSVELDRGQVRWRHFCFSIPMIRARIERTVRSEMNNRRITITVVDGMVTDVSGVPEGYDVEIDQNEDGYKDPLERIAEAMEQIAGALQIK